MRFASAPMPTISSSPPTVSPRALAAREPEADVGLDVQMWEEGALLGHIADSATLRGHVGAAVVEGGAAE